jgi:lipopolysaccharide/colanic/teichoic acid biosynthesis glycosyltransferase
LRTQDQNEITDPYQPPPAPPSYEALKRALDLSIAAFILVLLSPLWLLIAAAIRLSSEGPALFRRGMVGRGGRPFTYFKFRTMREGDDSHHREWLHAFVTRDAPYAGADFKVRDDPRVTGIGALLRRLSLDEVPQLLNVLRGEMSVVGPRPPIPYEFSLYDDRAKQRLAVKPGITGLYQITARSSVPFSTMLQIDLDYIARRSLGLDLSIILRTPVAMLNGRGAG